MNQVMSGSVFITELDALKRPRGLEGGESSRKICFLWPAEKIYARGRGLIIDYNARSASSAAASEPIVQTPSPATVVGRRAMRALAQSVEGARRPAVAKERSPLGLTHGRCCSPRRRRPVQAR